MGTLADLCTFKRTTLDRLAVAVGVDPLLLKRIDQGRQGIPIALVPLVATALRTDNGTVEKAAGCVQEVAGTQRVYVPLPPRPELGDPL